jgi:nucleoside-diphosphate-sugar epimerase
MNILISGATGFIGRNLITKLLEEGHKIFAIVRPSTNTSLISGKTYLHVYTGDVEKLSSFMAKEKIDGVVHLASLFLTHHNPKNIRELLESNLVFSTELLDASVRGNVSWFVNTGTFWQHYKNKDYSPVNLYAATKQAFEVIAKYYMETSDIKFITIKLFGTFGPSDTRKKIFNLWSEIIETGETLDMSPGNQVVDMSYIDNIIDGYSKMISLLSEKPAKKLSGQSFIIPSDKRLTLKKLAKVFEQISKKKLNINWGGKPYNQREIMVPPNKGRKIPGWKPLVSLEEGIIKSLSKNSDGK